MLHTKIKSIFFGLLLLGSIQFAACKSKPKDANTTTQTAPIDTSTNMNTTPVAPVEVSTDDALQTGLRDATKDYPDVKTSISNGEVTLTGNITRDKLPNLMQSINALHPKKINNNLTIK